MERAQFNWEFPNKVNNMYPFLIWEGLFHLENRFFNTVNIMSFITGWALLNPKQNIVTSQLWCLDFYRPG